MATKVGTGYVDIIGNFAPLNKQLTSSSLKSRFASIAKIGALAGAAIGVAAVKAADDFEHSMTLISTQAGASRKEVKKLSGEVLDLGRKSIFGPQDLADALFRVESAGFRGQKAMKVLNASQKLATVGSSDLESTTYAVVAAQKTQIKGTQQLGDEIGTLNAIVGQGNLRMDDLTAALSTGILPTAKAFGLTLTDVGAALDVFTSRGVPASAAATRLRMTISLLGAQTPQAEKALAGIGIKAGQLGEILTRKGLVAAVQMLTDHLKQAGDRAQQAQVITEAFGGGRTSSGILTLTQNVDDLRARYQGITKAAGDFSEKLKEARADPINQLKEAAAQLQSMLIRLGTTIAVPFADAVHKVTTIITDPHTGFSEKLSQLADLIAHALVTGIPKIVEAAVKIGGEVAKGILTGFLHASPISQIALIGGFIALFGGKAAFARIGLAIAAPLWGAIESRLAIAVMAAPTSSLLFRAATGLSGVLATGMKAALPAAIAGIGIAEIISSATQGDWHKAGFQIGGALAGGIAGFFLTKSPMGAMIGAGLGAQLGGLLSGLFTQSKHIKNAQQRIADSAREVTKAFHAERDSAQLLQSSGHKVEQAQQRQKRASEGVKHAENELMRARDRYGPNSKHVIDAEIKVSRAKDRDRRATHDLKQAEQLHGAALQIERARLENLVNAEAFHINQLKGEKQHVLDAIANERRRGASWSDLADKFGPKLDKVTNQLNKSNVQYNNTINKAATEISPKYAKGLADQGRELGGISKRFKAAQQATDQQTRAVQKQTRALDPLGKGILQNLTKPTIKAQDTVHKATPKIQSDVRATGTSFTQWAQTAHTADQNIIDNAAALVKGFGGAKMPKISLTEPKGGGKTTGGKMRGGVVELAGGAIVPGRGSGDKVPLHIGGQLAAFVEPGELVSVTNRTATAMQMAINSRIPRRAAGGPVDYGGHPSNVSPAISKLIGVMEQHFPGLVVTATTDGSHASGSYHYKGEAVDMSSGNYSYMDRAANYVKTSGIYHQLIEGIHNPNLSVAGGQFVPPSYWGATTWAEHQNHLHLAIAGALSGAFGGAAQQIVREILTGSSKTDPRMIAGQAALDKGRAAANAWIAKTLVPTGGVGYISPGSGAVMKQIYTVLSAAGFNKIGAAGIIGNAYGESSLDPGAVGTGGGGLWGFTASPISLADLQAFARQSGKSWTDVGLQTQFMLNHGGLGLRGELNAASSAAEAAIMFMNDWEHPGILRTSVRTGAAQRAYAAGYQGGGIIDGKASGGSGGASAGGGGNGGRGGGSRRHRRHQQNLQDFWRNIHWFRNPPLSQTTGVPKPEPITSISGIRRRHFNIDYIMRTLGTGRIPPATWVDYIHGFGSMGKRIARFEGITGQAAIHDDYATTAQSLDVTDDTSGVTTPGKFRDKTYPEWLNWELQDLFTLRNALVRTLPAVEHTQHFLTTMYNKARKAQAALNKLIHDTNIIIKHLQKRWDNIKKLLTRLQALKKPTKGQKDRLKGLSRMGRLVYFTLGHNKERLARFMRQKSGMKQVMPALRDRAAALGTLKQSILTGGDSFTGLNDVQGLGRTMAPLKKLPAIGELGGQILQVQLEMRDVTGSDAGAVGGSDLSGSDTTDSTLSDLLAQQVAALQRQSTIAEMQLPVFEQLANELGGQSFGGIYHTGGRVGGIPGHPVRISAMPGEMVFPEDSPIGGAPIVNLYIDKDAGVDPARIRTEVNGVLTDMRGRSRRMIGARR